MIKLCNKILKRLIINYFQIKNCCWRQKVISTIFTTTSSILFSFQFIHSVLIHEQKNKFKCPRTCLSSANHTSLCLQNKMISQYINWQNVNLYLLQYPYKWPSSVCVELLMNATALPPENLQCLYHKCVVFTGHKR